MDPYYYRNQGQRVTSFAHVTGLTALVLMLIWLLRYREGLSYDSETANQVFNVHPFLMFFGLIFIGGEAMMAYKTGQNHETQKFVHMTLNLIAITLGIVGISAVFKYHRMLNLADLNSLHSWIGITTICLFCLQWLFGLSVFMCLQNSDHIKYRLAPWHGSLGRALLYMAVGAALTGLMEKTTFLNLQNAHELRLINFTGLTILLFGILVDLSAAFTAYRVRP